MKLECYGNRGVCVDWFNSYLTGSKQYVTYNGIPSNTKLMQCGIPQWSILY